MGSLECDEELELGDMVDMGLDEVLKCSTVHPLKYSKTTNIERLGKMRGVRREAEGNDVLLLAELLERGRLVAQVAVQDDHPIYTLPSYGSMLVEILDPIQSRIIVRPAVY